MSVFADKICLLKLSTDDMHSTIQQNLDLTIASSSYLSSHKPRFEQVTYSGLDFTNEMSGDIISLVRKRRAFSPVIILTDTVDVPTAVRWMKSGVDDVLDISRFSELEGSLKKLIPEYLDLKEEKAKGHYLHLIAEHLDEIIFEFDYDPSLDSKWKLNFMSSSFTRVLGYSTVDFIDEPSLWAEHIHPDDRLEVEEKTRFAIHKAKSVFRKYRFKHAESGNYRWLEDHLSPVTDSSGCVVQLIGIARDVESQQKATRELETKQLMLTEAERLAKLGSWKFDYSKGDLEISESLKDLIGLNGIHKPVGADFLSEFVPAEGKSSFEHAVNQVRDDGGVMELEHDLNNLKGERRSVQTTIRAIPGLNGHPKGLLGTTLDITELKKQKKELTETNRFISHIIDTSPSIIYVIDYQSKLMVHGMRRFANYFGYDPEEIELMPKGVDSLVHPDDLAAIQQQEKRLAEGENNLVESTEFRVKHRAGHWVWVSVYSKVFEWDNEHKPLKAIGTVVDINKRKESDKKFEAVAENASAGIFIIQNERLSYANPAISEITGYLPDELKGRSFLQFLHPRVRDEASRFSSKMIHKASKKFRKEQVIVRKDNSECFVEITSTVINFQGQPAILGVVFDISERRKSEMERNEFIDQLTRQNKNLEEFSYIISHKLRSPVASILGLVEIIDSNSLNDQNKEVINHLKRSTSSLDSVIQDLSRTLRSSMSVSESKERVVVSAVLKSVRQSLAEEIEESKAIVAFDANEQDKVVTVRSHFQNILYNLVSNAIKYRDPERPIIVKIRTRIESGQFVLDVIDNGLGLDIEANKDRLFRLYERFHSHQKGRGIGLYLVKTQAEALGGSVSADGQLGLGCTFTLRLPL